MSEIFIVILNLFRHFYWKAAPGDFPNVPNAVGFVSLQPGAIRRIYFGDRPGQTGPDRITPSSRRYIDRYSSRRMILSIPDARRDGQDTVEFSSWVLGQTRAHLENFQMLRIPTNASRIVIQKYFPGVVSRRNCRSKSKGNLTPSKLTRLSSRDSSRTYISTIVIGRKVTEELVSLFLHACLPHIALIKSLFIDKINWRKLWPNKYHCMSCVRSINYGTAIYNQ